jgi:hypothetical protein
LVNEANVKSKHSKYSEDIFKQYAFMENAILQAKEKVYSLCRELQEANKNVEFWVHMKYKGKDTKDKDFEYVEINSEIADVFFASSQFVNALTNLKLVKKKMRWIAIKIEVNIHCCLPNSFWINTKVRRPRLFDT